MPTKLAGIDDSNIPTPAFYKSKLTLSLKDRLILLHVPNQLGIGMISRSHRYDLQPPSPGKK